MGNPVIPAALGRGYTTKTNKIKQNKSITIKQHEPLQRPGWTQAVTKSIVEGGPVMPIKHEKETPQYYLYNISCASMVKSM